MLCVPGYRKLTTSQEKRQSSGLAANCQEHLQRQFFLHKGDALAILALVVFEATSQAIGNPAFYRKRPLL